MLIIGVGSVPLEKLVLGVLQGGEEVIPILLVFELFIVLR